MKKVKWIVFMSMILFCCGCSSDHQDEEMIVGNDDPAPITEKERSMHVILGMSEDTDYTNIHADSKEAEYTLDTEYVTCVLTNENVGKGFYYYSVPFIEAEKDGEWVRLLNDSEDVQYAQWAFCGREGNTTEPNSCAVKTALSDITPEMTAGKYRFVVFTAENTLYAEFQLVS